SHKVMNAFGGGASQAKPPEKGSFPLDHYGECKDQMKVRGLMQQENLDLLGFNPESYAKARAKAAPVEGLKEST
ncbi:hypothetical protein B5M09_001236, partial [Aphanomyces astaci]